MRRRRARPEGEGRPQAGQGGGGEGGRLGGPRERAWRGPGEPEPTGREHRGGGGRVRLQARRGRKEKPGKSDLVGVGGACSSGGGLELPGMLAGGHARSGLRDVGVSDIRGRQVRLGTTTECWEFGGGAGPVGWAGGKWGQVREN